MACSYRKMSLVQMVDHTAVMEGSHLQVNHNWREVATRMKNLAEGSRRRNWVLMVLEQQELRTVVIRHLRIIKYYYVPPENYSKYFSRLVSQPLVSTYLIQIHRSPSYRNLCRKKMHTFNNSLRFRAIYAIYARFFS